MVAISNLVAREWPCRSGYYYNGNGCYPRTAWTSWGRWVLAGALLLFVILIFVILTCITSRRRRKRGLVPMYGTGWMAPGGGKYGGNQQQQPWGGYYNQPPPPQYQPNQQTGTTFDSNQGYYGGHNEGVQLQQPQYTYQPGQQQGVYAPPAGPPPGK